MNQVYDLIILGGGAAGFFSALRYKELQPSAKVLILEKGPRLLDKVKISGGGRCNVTHACFDPHQLVSYYPRGGKELLGPFMRFNCSDTIRWFAERGVILKTEEDGRMFPDTDSSSTVTQCFLNQANKSSIKILTQSRIDGLEKMYQGWKIHSQGFSYSSEKIMVCTGSNQEIWSMLGHLGHNIITPVPSLFTFKSTDCTLKNLAGVTFKDVALYFSHGGFKQMTSGPLLITHQGISGPAALKMSAWCARVMHAVNYHFTLKINWINTSMIDTHNVLINFQKEFADKQISNTPPFDTPSRWWKNMLDCHQIDSTQRWKQLNSKVIQHMATLLTGDGLEIKGKNTNKDEFVTAGGVDLKEVDTRRFESKIHQRLFFAGEVLNIDALTGGFNFQAAWTTAWVAATAAAETIQ